jgi:uncharacterized protein YeeX (DUF496 family)
MQTRLNLHPISAIALTLSEFHSLVENDVLVSPSGNIFSYGENVQEFVDSGYEEKAKTGDGDYKEYHITDNQGTIRKILFIDGVSEYGLVIGINGKVEDTSGIQKKIGNDYDQEWNDYVDSETNWVDQ